MIKNKKLVVILAIVLGLIILVGGFLLYKSYKYNKNTDLRSPEARLKELEKLQRESSTSIPTPEESRNTMKELDKNNNAIKELTQEERLLKLKELSGQ